MQMSFPNLKNVLGRMSIANAGMRMQVSDITANLGQQVADVAQDLVAKDTWLTHDSIRVEKRGGDTYVVADRQGNRPEVPVMLEFGTHKMAARPFMKPALQMVLASGGLARSAKAEGGLLGPTYGRK